MDLEAWFAKEMVLLLRYLIHRSYLSVCKGYYSGNFFCPLKYRHRTIPYCVLKLYLNLCETL